MTMCGNKNYGEFELTISDGEWRGMQCYMIHLTEENIDADAPKLMSIIAHVSETFTLLEQSTHEYIKIPERTMDVKTLIVREAGKYVVQKTVSQDNCERKTLETFSTTQMEGFICEACHVVLQRFFLKKGFPENAVFLTFDSETNISSMSFKVLGVKELIVENRTVMTKVIESSLSSLMKQDSLRKHFFIPDGRLMLRTEENSNVTLKQLQSPRSLTPEQPDVMTPLNWQEDMQLFSEFLDRKDELIDEHNTYLRRHPEFQAILADFLQYLLFRKPQDIFASARNFFSGMSLFISNQDSDQ
ncbi:ciliogenesis-associated TTC17-interacting protein-like isoform X2 [Xenia sp. Carnegie-2017]|nr:ciliogenesis-associated TTC17-interacting protein-like isoform X2 [Xenia sp. Carnegie-2017]